MSARERVGDRGQRQAEACEVRPHQELSGRSIEADATPFDRDRAIGKLGDE